MLKRLKLGFVLLGVVALAWFGVSAATYRLLAGQAQQVIEGNVHFKFVELEGDNRAWFESIFDNRRIRLEDASVFYVPGKDLARVWATHPWELEEMGLTLQVKLAADPLFFGGYGPARVISIVQVRGKARVSK
jgi:hypothetical protein